MARGTFGQPLSILVVDDSDVVLNVTRTVLEAAGYRVLTHAGPSGCVAVILQEKPDLVLLDVNMPKLGGETIVKLFGKAQPNSETIILLFSTLSSEQLDQRAQQAGAHGFIRKTEDSFELVRQVNRWLRPKELLQKGRAAALELDGRSASGAALSGQRRAGVKSAPPGPAKLVRGSRPPLHSRPPPKTSGTSRLLPVVLFIDDMDALSELRRAVQGEPYRADFALSVAQAMRHIESTARPDLIVVNVELAGIEVFQRAVVLDVDWAGRFVLLMPEVRPARESDFPPPSAQNTRVEDFLRTFDGVVLARPLDSQALRDTLRRLISTHARADERSQQG
jgi:CheY-like chemotaxis protein